MSHDFDRFWRIFDLMNESAVELSVFMGVGGCGWPNFDSIYLIERASCELKNNAAVSASAADATM